MEFKIGEKVRHPIGGIGTIVDILSSDKTGKCYYKVQFDGKSKADSCLYKEDDLTLYGGNHEYIYEFEYLENLVVARLYEITDGKKAEIKKGHGHIFHDGAYGVAQAAAYALKKIAEDLGGGSLISYKNSKLEEQL